MICMSGRHYKLDCKKARLPQKEWCKPCLVTVAERCPDCNKKAMFEAGRDRWACAECDYLIEY